MAVALFPVAFPVAPMRLVCPGLVAVSRAMTMSMMVEHFTKEQTASLGSPGIDELRWLKPVYPGDTLRVEAELIEKRQSKSKPHMGFTKSRQTVFNQHDEPVLSMISNGIVKVREP